MTSVAEQLQRAQRVGKRHGAEEKIGQQIIDAEFLDLPFDFGAHGLRRAGDHRAVGDDKPRNWRRAAR